MEPAVALRTSFLQHGFTMDAVLATLGGEAFAALGRGETVPSEHVLADRADDPQTDLIRLFLLGESVPLPRATAAMPLAEADLLQLVARTEGDRGERVRARLHVQPYPFGEEEGYVVSDFPANRLAGTSAGLASEHVAGVGGASMTLATITPRTHVATALDLGTGCGIQALLASSHSARVVATDRSERALRLAGLTAGLSGVSFDLRAGSLFEPVQDQVVDLLVANPPFVISPHARFTYREAPLRADDLSRSVVTQAADRLAEGGVAVVLANWLHLSGESWHDRLAGWAPSDCQVWAVQRERSTPSEYVELWLRDSAERGAPGYRNRYSEWLTYFDDLGASGVGFGWIVVRRGGAPWFTAEDLSDAERLPSGQETLAQLDHYAALHDASAVRLLAGEPRWTPAAELHRSTRPAAPGETGLLATGAWRPAEPVDPEVVSLLADEGPLVERIERRSGGTADVSDDLTASALVGIRRLIGAGLVDLGA